MYDGGPGGTGGLRTEKAHTTPAAFEQGSFDAVRKAGASPATIAFFAHGCTVVIDALTGRKGVRTGLITTRGFRDVLEIARGNRPDFFNFMFEKPEPFVPRYLRAELDERLDSCGKVLRPLDLAALPPILESFRGERIEAIAVCFLHAYVNPTHERQVAAAVRRLWPEVAVVASHEVSREWREYERFNTAALTAYVHPIANRYLSSLELGLAEAGFAGRAFVMESSGGISTIREAKRNPITMVESGPASGVLGAAVLGRLIGEPSLITPDVGGTTAKCSLIADGRPRITTDYRIEYSRLSPGYPIKAPVIDIVEIGAGGGSIAWLDEGGKLRVGPRSAGAVPGPAADGRGGEEPTLTDANLLTGRIDPAYFLGGEIVPNLDAARSAFAHLGRRMGVAAEEVARGVIRIANAGMVNALKLVSVNRGHDPRDFALVAFGGGGLHAAALARELGMPRVIIPVCPAVFSAWGMLQSDLRRDYLRTRLVRLEGGDGAAAVCAGLFGEMEGEAWRDCAADGIEPGHVVLDRLVDMRYADQEFTVKVPFPGGAAVTAGTLVGVAEAFHVAHEREFTFRLDSPVAIVNFHLVATGVVRKPEIPRLVKTGRRLEDALRGTCRVDLDADGVHDGVPIYERAGLETGMVISGPAIVEEPDTTSSSCRGSGWCRTPTATWWSTPGRAEREAIRHARPLPRRRRPVHPGDHPGQP